MSWQFNVKMKILIGGIGWFGTFMKLLLKIICPIDPLVRSAWTFQHLFFLFQFKYCTFTFSLDEYNMISIILILLWYYIQIFTGHFLLPLISNFTCYLNFVILLKIIHCWLFPCAPSLNTVGFNFVATTRFSNNCFASHTSWPCLSIKFLLLRLCIFASILLFFIVWRSRYDYAAIDRC